MNFERGTHDSNERVTAVGAKDGGKKRNKACPTCEVLVENVQKAFGFHGETVDGVFVLFGSIAVEVPEPS